MSKLDNYLDIIIEAEAEKESSGQKYIDDIEDENEEIIEESAEVGKMKWWEFGTKLYDHIQDLIESKSKECGDPNGLKGKDRIKNKICYDKAALKTIPQAIKILEEKIAMCDKTDEPEKCRASIKKDLSHLKEELRYAKVDWEYYLALLGRVDTFGRE